MTTIKKQLESLGYNGELDITQIELDNRGNFSMSSKGSKETQNMLY